MVNKLMDYRYFYEHHVGINKIKYTGDQGLGRCLAQPFDRNPSFSFNNKSDEVSVLDVVLKAIPTYLQKNSNLRISSSLLNLVVNTE